MAVDLLIRNVPTRWLTGMVVGAFAMGHPFGRLESKAVFEQKKAEFMLTNDPRYLEEFPREYVIVRLLDKEVEDPEVASLLERGENGLPLKRFIPVTQGSPYYQSLLDDAFLAVNYAEALPLIEDVI